MGLRCPGSLSAGLVIEARSQKKKKNSLGNSLVSGTNLACLEVSVGMASAIKGSLLV